MERKIGEIFEYNGEWYQCGEGRCRGCYFSEKRYLCKQFITKGFCISGIIFKRLEKVGEPYEFGGHLFQSYHTFEVPIFTENYATVRELGNNSKISIEIKQTKEDMEEKKLNLKPFDIQKAREGKSVCTRDGKKARIICFDKQEGLPIVALVETKVNGRISEEIALFYINGRAVSADIDSKLDLMMLSEKHEGWVNICKETSDKPYALCNIFEHRKDAVESGQKRKDYLATVKISWEE